MSPPAASHRSEARATAAKGGLTATGLGVARPPEAFLRPGPGPKWSSWQPGFCPLAPTASTQSRSIRPAVTNDATPVTGANAWWVVRRGDGATDP
jgi:hypothetical protein